MSQIILVSNFNTNEHKLAANMKCNNYSSLPVEIQLLEAIN